MAGGAEVEYRARRGPEGRIIVVTGASGGIGGALVRALVERDARLVVACDVVSDGVERLSAELGEERWRRGRSTSATKRRRVLSWTRSQSSIGPIDVFFANAGIATGGGAEAPTRSGIASGGST